MVVILEGRKRSWTVSEGSENWRTSLYLVNTVNETPANYFHNSKVFMSLNFNIFSQVNTKDNLLFFQWTSCQKRIRIQFSGKVLKGKVKASHNLAAVGAVGVKGPFYLWCEAHSSPFTALSFPKSKKVLIYCWANRGW